MWILSFLTCAWRDPIDAGETEGPRTDNKKPGDPSDAGLVFLRRTSRSGGRRASSCCGECALVQHVTKHIRVSDGFRSARAERRPVRSRASRAPPRAVVT